MYMVNQEHTENKPVTNDDGFELYEVSYTAY